MLPRLTHSISALCLGLAGLAAGLAPAPARAEKADREKPVNIEADRMFYDDLRQVNIFEGNVTLTQGTLVIRTDKLTVKQDPEGFQHGTAEKGAQGLAYFRQKRDNVDEYIEGWGERIEYDAKTEKANLIARARVLRGNDEVRGSLINYDGRTEFYTVTGGKQSATPNNPDGKVRATIQPNKAAAATPGGPAPSAPGGMNLRSSGGIAAPRETYPEVPKK
jgi:lipopolysaccharide export system protein LptA